MQSKFQGDAPTQEASNESQTRELTFGEKLVGITFNPANDDSVSKSKKVIR